MAHTGMRELLIDCLRKGKINYTHDPKSHKTTTLEFDGKPVQIDERIAPLIERLWGKQYVTVSCCEEIEKNTAFITFFEPDAKKFQRLLKRLKVMHTTKPQNVPYRSENTELRIDGPEIPLRDVCFPSDRIDDLVDALSD